MSLLLRPFRPSDYVAIALCNRAAMLGTDDTAESLRDDDGHTTAFERWVAEAGVRSSLPDRMASPSLAKISPDSPSAPIGAQVEGPGVAPLPLPTTTYFETRGR